MSKDTLALHVRVTRKLPGEEPAAAQVLHSAMAFDTPVTLDNLQMSVASSLSSYLHAFVVCTFTTKKFLLFLLLVNANICDKQVQTSASLRESQLGPSIFIRSVVPNHFAIRMLFVF